MEKVKLVIFDLDGVLVEAKNLHYEALNKALGKEYSISWKEHLSKYDGLKTNQKLEMLTQEKGLPVELHSQVWENKQKYTLEELRNLKPNQTLQSVMNSLVEDGYKIAVCSNSIRKTVLTVLSKLGIMEFMDYIISNEDVGNSKPHPEMYWRAISKMGCLPEETLIVEDSPYGLLAASRAKAHILRVKNPSEVTYTNIFKKLTEIEKGNIMKMPAWKDEKLNVIIPMAGAGSRFIQAGYTFPKPLIDVKGKPMIQVVTEMLNIEANYVYVVQKEHRQKYNLDTLLNLITPGCKIVETEGVTEGAACTALLAKEHINTNAPLLFANSDQHIVWDSTEFFYKMNETDVDGGILCFKGTHPKWSFAKVDENNKVVEVAEKNPISDNATVGLYYWKYGSDFVKYAEQMIEKNIRVNNEFYVCPVYNEAIQDDKHISCFMIEKDAMWGLGTPEDLNYYLENFK
jgi:HAD superfamily hydrolase (TIGR01509 family)